MIVADLETKLAKIAEEKGSLAAWESMSMGEGRKLEPYGECSKSPDGMHHYTAVSCVQSVEHFVCDFCQDSWWD